MFLRILAMFSFAAGLILLLYGTYALMTAPKLGMYVTFFAFLLWGAASIFILMSRSAQDRIQIRPPKPRAR